LGKISRCKFQGSQGSINLVSFWVALLKGKENGCYFNARRVCDIARGFGNVFDCGIQGKCLVGARMFVLWSSFIGLPDFVLAYCLEAILHPVSRYWPDNGCGCDIGMNTRQD
jgi:hypothetical protein